MWHSPDAGYLHFLKLASLTHIKKGTKLEEAIHEKLHNEITSLVACSVHLYLSSSFGIFAFLLDSDYPIPD